MATSAPTMPGQGQGASPSGGPSGAPQGAPPDQSQGAPSQGQADQLQKLLANWYNVAKQMAASDPRLAEGAELVSQGVQKMQTALVTPPQQTPIGQQPSY